MKQYHIENEENDEGFKHCNKTDITGRDSMRCYLQDMSYHEMIDADDEKRLSIRIHKMNIAERLKEKTIDKSAENIPEENPDILLHEALKLLLSERYVTDKRNLYVVCNKLADVKLNGIEELTSELTKEEIERLEKLLKLSGIDLKLRRSKIVKDEPVHLKTISIILNKLCSTELSTTQKSTLNELTSLYAVLLDDVIKQGKEASDSLAIANLRLVVNIAKKHAGKHMGIQDLIQEGNLGLLRAIEKYDYKRGFRFATYATWWIKQAVTRAIANQGKTIRIPMHMVEIANKYYKAYGELLQINGREPDENELSEYMNVPVVTVIEIQNIIQDPISIYEPVGDKKESTLGEFIEDNHYTDVDPEENISNLAIKENIEEALRSLSDKEQNVLRMRFGFSDGIIHSLEEIGKMYGVTRERIRQIEANGIKKLNRPNRLRYLKGLLR